jgi:hypothetical protein
MSKETEEICGHDLARLLGESSLSDNASRIAKEVGFDISPFLGAKKKRVQIEGELAMLNMALIVFAVNQRLSGDEARLTIDSFFKHSTSRVFRELEMKKKEKYPQRLAEYFRLLKPDSPQAPMALSFAFMNHLDIDPIRGTNSLERQLRLSAHILALLQEAIAIVENHQEPEKKEEFKSQPDEVKNVLAAIDVMEEGDDNQSVSSEVLHHVMEFEKEIADWPPEQAIIALELILAITRGEKAKINELYPKLTLNQFNAVYNHTMKVRSHYESEAD